MKANTWAIILMLAVGVGVGAFSLYTASLSGVKAKMGLLGGDINQSLDQNQLSRNILSIDRDYDCSTWHIAKDVPRYLFSRGEERTMITLDLGGDRIICGVKHVKSGNVERGAYTIVKGLYYLRSHYIALRDQIQNGSGRCSDLEEPLNERWVEAYLDATEGSLHEAVYKVYKEVESARNGVEELCVN